VEPTSACAPRRQPVIHAPGSGEDRSRYAVPLLGLMAFVLTAGGLSGVGDAPAPHDSAQSMAAHFQAVGDAVLTSAPAGMVGALALFAFMLALARRLHGGGQSGAAAAVAAGGVLVAGYLLFIQVVYASLAYAVAETSPEVTKGFFVSTIVATAVFGLGAALALGGAAYGAARGRLLPGWWSVVSLAGAALAAVALFSYADSDVFSPDVQQQVVAGVVQTWVLLTVGTLVLRGRQVSRQRSQHRR
jgi:hypothetical protein